LTYLDVLSTLPLIRGEREFLKAIDRVIREVADFDRDAKVQVFEGESSRSFGPPWFINLRPSSDYQDLGIPFV
jgi:hypothetical protein